MQNIGYAFESPHIQKRMLLTSAAISIPNDTGVIMSAMASQITSLTIVYSTVYLHAYQRKHPSSASLAFVRGIHRTKRQQRGKCFPLMTSLFRFTLRIRIIFRGCFRLRVRLSLWCLVPWINHLALVLDLFGQICSVFLCVWYGGEGFFFIMYCMFIFYWIHDYLNSLVCFIITFGKAIDWIVYFALLNPTDQFLLLSVCTMGNGEKLGQKGLTSTNRYIG